MDNHYRFVLHTLRPNFSFLMHHINGAYNKRFYWSHGKMGRLFEGRSPQTGSQNNSQYRNGSLLYL